jgi:uncharacterized protein YqgC (DUF456 family)
VESPLWLLAAILVLVGIAGTVLPALPGAPLVFLGLVCGAWADGFRKVGWFTISILAVLMVLTFIVDFLASRWGAKRVGASWLALVGAFLGTIAGLFFSLPGLIFGPFLGAVAGEWLAVRNLRQAGKVGLGTWLGMILGIGAKLALVFAMVGIFALAYAF